MPLSNRLRNSVRDAVLSIAAYFLLGPGHYSVVARRVAEKQSGAHDRRGRTCVVMSQGLLLGTRHRQPREHPWLPTRGPVSV